MTFQHHAKNRMMIYKEDIDQNVENRQFGGPDGGHFEFRNSENMSH